MDETNVLKNDGKKEEEEEGQKRDIQRVNYTYKGGEGKYDEKTGHPRSYAPADVTHVTIDPSVKEIG
eukprot:2461901-Ditylum_brightwellii.AAC.1